MGKKIAIDFGTSNTTVAYWNETLSMAEIIEFDGISRKYRNPEKHDDIVTFCIPSVINFHKKHILIGQEVFNKGKEMDKGTFKDIKRYIMKRKDLSRDTGKGKKVSFYEAGEAFLKEIILKTKNYLNNDIGEIVFTLPVDSFQYYQEWISELCRKVKIDRYRVIDEPTACALGYEANIRDNNISMVFDFGGGTLDVSIVKFEPSGNEKKSLVLGKAGASIGGIDIDGWILEDLLLQNDLKLEEVQHIINLLLQNIEDTKIDLSFHNESSLSIFDDLRGTLVTADYKRENFEDILKRNHLYSIIQETIDDALEEAALKGVRRRQIKEVLMIGGSSLIPSIRDLLEEKFGDRVKAFRPFDAVVKGGCFYAGGKSLDDYIKHDYCLKHWIWSEDRRSGKYGYQPFIPKGTKYPAEEVAKFKIDAAVPGQKEVELMIFEVRANSSQKVKNEMIYNPETEKYEIKKINASGEEDRVIVNEKNPTFIKLDPPAKGGEKRISVSFAIDENRLLRITVIDLKNNSVLYKNQPVVKLV